jgi:hypothetical protein
VLLALATQHESHPGVGLSAKAVIVAGWPDERILHEAAMLRVYNVVRLLRALGLGHDVLLTRDDGYLLHPSTVVVRDS